MRPKSYQPALLPTPVKRADDQKYRAKNICFQGVPGVAVAPNGRLWAAWYAGGFDEGPDNFILIATSTDSGNSWSQPIFTIDPPGKVRAFDPVPWIDPSGVMWVFYAQSFGFWDGRGGVFAVSTSNPNDAEPLWGSPFRLASGIMLNKPITVSAGTWLYPVSHWIAKPVSDEEHGAFVPRSQQAYEDSPKGAYVYESSDQGNSCRRLGGLLMPNSEFDEHHVLERRDGSIWMLARTAGGNHGRGIAQAFSYDGGLTWTGGEESTIPHVRSRFFVRRLKSGRMLMVKHNPKMDTAWLDQSNCKKSWKNRSDLTAYLSDDDGHSWYGGLLLDARVGVSYPDGDQASDERIYIVYDYNRYSDRVIYMARITEADISEAQIVAPGSKLRIVVNQAMCEV